MISREYSVFGPAGNSDMFYDAGYKRSAQMPAFLKEVGLNWYEYPCGRGVNVGQDTAKEIGGNAAENGISMSVHAPYFINFANPELEKELAQEIIFFRLLTLLKLWMQSE